MIECLPSMPELPRTSSVNSHRKDGALPYLQCTCTTLVDRKRKKRLVITDTAIMGMARRIKSMTMNAAKDFPTKVQDIVSNGGSSLQR